MSRRLIQLWFCVAALSGCATTDEAGQVETRAAVQNGPPAFAALPDVSDSKGSARIAQGLSLARQIMGDRLPVAPDDRAYQTLQLWIDHTVTPWIAKRRDSVDETRFQFGLGRNDTSPSERIIAEAVLGLLQEDTAIELDGIPQPTELDTEPEVAAIFRDLVRTQAAPFRNAAIREYTACANRGYAEGSAWRPWATFCHRRHDRLQVDDSSAARSTASR
jgi:hypothetical protein